MMTVTFGRMPASSQASSELSTASLTAVSSALEGLSKPSRWRFLVKNSLMEISRCLEAIDSAVARRPGRAGLSAGGAAGAGSSSRCAATGAGGRGGGGLLARGGGGLLARAGGWRARGGGGLLARGGGRSASWAFFAVALDDVRFMERV